MNENDVLRWERFKESYTEFGRIGLAIDLSRTHLDSKCVQDLNPKLQGAFQAMDALEAGSIANPDEKRMVGHYWLRNSALAPKPEIKRDIDQTLGAVKGFAHEVHSGAIQGERGSF